MKVAKGPIVVQSYHYDLVNPDSEVKTDLQVQVQDYNDSEEIESTEGKMIQIMTPFGIHPEQAPFAISGLIGQVVQLQDVAADEDYTLSTELMEELSRPLVEQIQIITYQLTAMTLDHGYELNFQPNTGDNEDLDD
ncbi:DUF1149 domain-containing protein [Bombilactobacillus bombi]|uniref:DUF1149 domain-containing protein n=1 Tax=Bombilactobacillus bombi TaxID=1303590 RepID=A0A3R6YS20_9LACO|nr:DUF1149 family protein [Bombilactobacillus bombi]RHW50170.1 DUF1149 domain-containing protein [Bombilactobacillus bombi]